MHQYHLSRNGKVLGIYPEDRMKEYFAEGRVGPKDLVWHEGMDNWLPASQVFGADTQGEAASAPPPLTAPVPLATASPAALAPQPADTVPLPPRLHWGWVLLLTAVTFGLFYIVWTFVQANWVRRIDPRSNALTLMIIYVVLVIAGQAMAEGNAEDSFSALGGALLVLAGSIVSIFAFLSMRRSMLDYYNQREPIGLRLSGFMTVFLNVLYFQHHMSRIARWKTTGVLSPQ